MSTSHMDTEKMELDGSDVARASSSNNPTGIPGKPSVENPTNEPAGTGAPSTELAPAQANLPVVDPPPSIPLTSALEALLGGLDPPAPIAIEASAHVAKHIHPPVSVSESDAPTQSDSNDALSVVINPGIGDSLEAKVKEESPLPMPEDGDRCQVLGDTLDSASVGDLPKEEEHPEWEVDSSPIESSSDDSSSDDSSSDESEEGENSYKLLSPEEQARILMEEGGGSDDEDGGKGAKGSGSGLRTKNEVPDVVVPKPEVTITEDMPIKEIGNVENIIDNIALIKANTSGEYQVLESGSVLCLENKNVIGVVSETIGRVQQPFYSVMFTNSAELVQAGLAIGTKVYYPEKHATFVFTQALKAYKGSDASNLHDEEVGADEMEFSDDEAEAEHKRKVKQARIDRRGGRSQQNGGIGRTSHPLQQSTSYDPSKGISYDDVEDDGPYKPLLRPAGFSSAAHGEAPQEGQYQPSINRHSQNHNRDSFRGRGRGDRGRGRGDRGRGDRGRGRGGNHSDRRVGGGNGYSQAPQGHGHQSAVPGQGQPSFQQPQLASLTGQYPQFPQFPHNPAAVPSFRNNSEYSPNQPQLPDRSNLVPPPSFEGPHSFPNVSNISNMRNMPAMPNTSNHWPSNPAGSGAFLNPAFFNNPPSGFQYPWIQPNQQNHSRGNGGQ